MNYYGLIIGLVAFLIIGIFHPVVIKAEFYFGKKIWWIFMAVGIVLSSLSLFASNYYLSLVLGVIGFSCFWSVLELFKQHKRVIKGQAKMNPNRQDKYLSND